MTNPAEYAAIGMALTEIPKAQKGPIGAGWNLKENAITCPDIAALLTGNVGLLHAYCSPTPTMALDIDIYTQAEVWLAERGVDLEELMEAEDAVQINSGKKGSAKLLFRLTEGMAPVRTAQIKAPNDDMVLEFRCAAANGKTMQDVLPPSIHPDTGKPYQWGGKGTYKKIPIIPNTLLKVWLNQLAPVTPMTSAPTALKEAPDDEVGPLTIKHLRSALLSMRADDRDLWIKMGMALKSIGDDGRGIWMDWSLTSSKSQVGGPLMLSTTWDSFTPSQIGYKSVFAEAQRRGWVNPTKIIAEPCEEEPTTTSGWPTPQKLPAQLRSVRALPVNCLPSTVRDAITDIADRLSCPVDYVATPLLVGAGAIIGNRIGILPKQYDDMWEVYPTLWGGIVGPPGSMKTPAQQETMKPLRHIEEQESIAHIAQMTQYQADKKRYDKELSDFKSGKLKTIPVEPAEPKKRRLIVNDTTYQALGEILAANPEGVLIHGDELSGLLQSLDAPGQEAARGFYLTGWGGSGDYTFDRIARGSVRLTNYALSIFGGFQPDKIKLYVQGAQNGSSQNDGLLQRFQLLVWPDFDKEYTFVDRAPDRGALTKMNAAMLSLRALPSANGSHVKTNRHGRKLLHFDPAAQALFNQWYVKNEQLVRSAKLGTAEQSHYAKYRSLIPGLALMFHLLEGHNGAVCHGCLEAALQYGLYLKSHAQRLYGAVEGTDSSALRLLATKLCEGKLVSGFTARSIYTKRWGGLTKNEHVYLALDQLVELGWLREQVVDTGGRKKTEYTVNPDIPASLE